MARYEGSKRDRAEDKRGAKASGKSLRDYENSAQDRREDAAGERRAAKKPPMRSKPVSPPFGGMSSLPGGGGGMDGGPDDMSGLGGM